MADGSLKEVQASHHDYLVENHPASTTVDGVDMAKAKDNVRMEHQLGAWDAMKKFKKACSYAVFFAFAAILWGYDSQVNGGLIAAPQFRKAFGFVEPDGTTILAARWQAAFNAASTVGSVLGSLGFGYVAEMTGRRWSLMIASCISTGAIFLQFFAVTSGVLIAGKLINGVALGGYLVTACAYCSEICPVVLRGPTTAMINLFVVIGQLLGNVLIQVFGGRNDDFAFRIPFGFQWLFSTILVAGVWFTPESPYWYVRKGQLDKAQRVLRRLTEEQDVLPWLAQIKETVRIETEFSEKASFLECFKGTDLRRTLIPLALYTINAFSGVQFVLGYSTYFFEIAGLPTTESFSLGVGVTAVGIVGNIFSWWIINMYGRRFLFPGLIMLTTINLLIGILDCVPNYDSKIAWTQSSLIIVWNFVFDLSLGPIPYVLSSEISSTRLRSHTVGIAFMAQNFWALIVTIAVPYLITPTEANLRGKTGFIFGGLSVLSCIWAYFWLPETKGRTYEELDILFEKRVPSRKFAEYNFNSEQLSESGAI